MKHCRRLGVEGPQLINGPGAPILSAAKRNLEWDTDSNALDTSRNAKGRGRNSSRVSLNRHLSSNTLSAMPSPLTKSLCRDWNSRRSDNRAAWSLWNSLEMKDPIAIRLNWSWRFRDLRDQHLSATAEIPGLVPGIQPEVEVRLEGTTIQLWCIFTRDLGFTQGREDLINCNGLHKAPHYHAVRANDARIRTDSSRDIRLQKTTWSSREMIEAATLRVSPLSTLRAHSQRLDPYSFCLMLHANMCHSMQPKTRETEVHLVSFITSKENWKEEPYTLSTRCWNI